MKLGREQGSALIMAIVVMGVMVLLGVVALTSANRINRGGLTQRTRSGAIHAADAGVEYVRWRLRTGTVSISDPVCTYTTGGADAGRLTCTQQLGNRQSFNAVLSPSVFGADVSVTRTITSTGTVGSLTRQVRSDMLRQVDSFRLPLFADTGISVSGGGLIDWYDSRVGPYSPSPSPPHIGDIRSNGDITLAGGATVLGRATTTPGRTISVCNNCTVSGGTSTAGTRLEFPPPVVSDVEANNDNASLCAIPGDCHALAWTPATRILSVTAGRVRLRSGTYSLCQLAMSAGGSNVIELIPSNGPIRIFISGPETAPCAGQTAPLSIRGGSWVFPASQVASDFQVYVRGSSTVATTAEVRSGSNFLGAVYAPRSAFTIQAGADLFGGFVGSSLNVTGGGRIHYDRALAGATAAGSPWVRRLWLEL
ncbi:MAG TPA: hypothetical protein VM840_08985 [Actinomycetota bacterium]|nr:hypothetical protein [Actinomycetota bacterium]